MIKPIRHAAVAVGLGVALTASLAACTSGGSTHSGKNLSAAADEKVTITIGDQPPSNKPDERKVYDDAVKAFHAANPKITVKTTETVYDATSFQALVAGGKLPDVLAVPFTEARSLAANKQVADVTDALKAVGIYDKLNPTTLKLTQDPSGRAFGVPANAYSMGLVYNRDLFTKAGLDPNKPPTTWDEVRADAKKIADATGVPGFGQMAAKNTGGWIFSAITYSHGGTIENSEGTKASFDAAPAKAALQTLKDMRWTDSSMGANALYDYDGVLKDFAAGKFAMFIGAPDMYRGVVVNNKMDKKSFGMGGMPQSAGNHGTLTGGALEVVSPDATDAQQIAAVKWIDWYYLKQFSDQSAAVAKAKADAVGGQPVGIPGLPVVSGSTNAAYLKWIAGSVNVPLTNFAPYASSTESIPVIPEPAKKAQEVYAALDVVIQAVLSDKNSNIDSLLSSAAKTIEAKLGR